MHRYSLLIALSLIPNWADAQFPELFNTEPIAEDSWMPPEEAAEKMGLPDGFSASVFAAEPDVQNPIAMTWDSRGRLWVAENYTYAERTQRFQLDLRDRVVILDGSEGDQFETRTVFTDNVQMLTGIEVGHDGVWLMCPPKLIFIPDRNQDDVPDNAGEVVLDGFEVAKANYHNFANGLRFGPDGWLYGRCGGSCPGRIGKPGTPDEQRLALEGGIWRYHPINGQTEVLTTGTTNPWGHDWNDVGEMFFVNTVNGHLWQMIPGAHFTRPFTLDPNPRTYELIDFHADHWHFDTTGAWNESRDGVANQFGGGHAHCGAMIYQADNWPAEYRGNLFTLNFHGRRANQEILERKGSGYVAKHGQDVLLAADPWFRGMELSGGPDGSVFVLDWSDAGECHEHAGVHRTSGRVFKITCDSGPKDRQLTDVRDWSMEELVAAHVHPNVWNRRQARLELARRHAAGDDVTMAVEEFRNVVKSSPHAPTIVQALLTLHLIGGTKDKLLTDQLRHTNEHVRAWAVRLLTERFPLDDAAGPAWKSTEQAEKIQARCDGLLAQLFKLAKTDPSSLVRLTLASTIQRLPVEYRCKLAQPLVAHVQDADDHNIPLMIWYGLMPCVENHQSELVDVARACVLPTTLRLVSRALAEQIRERPEPMDALLGVAVARNQEYRSIVLTGITEGLKGWRRAPKPAVWESIIESDTEDTASLVRELSVVFGDGRALDELKSIALGQTDADSEMRTSALRTLIQSQPEDLRSICESLLKDARMNVLAARGLSGFDDPEIGRALVSRYNNFRAPDRPQLMSILVSRPAFAKQMLAAIEKGRIPRSDLSAYQVRQIHSHQDTELSRRVSEVWGEVRASPAAIEATIGAMKENLTSANSGVADKSAGRALFKRLCQNCHRLYGEGANVGPDLTGANRANLDYLLTNIIDPSAVVDKDFRMSILLLEDDRIVNGLIVAETGQTVSLQTATETITIPKDEIQSEKITEKSPMPDGLFETLSEEQVRDLIGYLQHPSQVPLP